MTFKDHPLRSKISPDFIGIGFRRCASSWLHRCLNEHPEIGKTEGGIHYFSNNLARGNAWYAEQFAPFRDRTVLIDFSVSYAYPENVGLLAQQLPRFQPEGIFAIVRNPIDRAYSDYRMALFTEELPPHTTFEQAINLTPILLERGRYRRLLEPVIDAISPKKLNLFFYDDVKSRPTEFWRNVCDYFGVSSDIIPSVLYTQLGHLSAPKHAGLHSFIRRVNRIISTAPLVGSGWKHLKRTSLWRTLLAIDTKKPEGVSPGTRRELLAYFADDIDFIESLTGRDLSGWRR